VKSSEVVLGGGACRRVFAVDYSRLIGRDDLVFPALLFPRLVDARPSRNPASVLDGSMRSRDRLGSRRAIAGQLVGWTTPGALLILMRRRPAPSRCCFSMCRCRAQCCLIDGSSEYLVNLDQKTESRLDSWQPDCRIEKRLGSVRAALARAEKEALDDVFRSDTPEDSEIRRLFTSCSRIWRQETGQPMQAQRHGLLRYYNGWPRDERIIVERHPMFIILDGLDIQMQRSSIDYLLNVDWVHGNEGMASMTAETVSDNGSASLRQSRCRIPEWAAECTKSRSQ
jgi:hypothetical protein